MPFWNFLNQAINKIDAYTKSATGSYDTSKYAFIDVEVGISDHKIHDIGAIRWDGATFHAADKQALIAFLKDVDFLCGHNIIQHDIKYLFGEKQIRWQLVDTLFVSPLLFPERPYHRLLKNDKLVSDQMNNPVNDCIKAKDLLMDEVGRWNNLSNAKKTIYASLLIQNPAFSGFLKFVHATAENSRLIEDLIQSEYHGKICENCHIEHIINDQPCELAYALALIDTTD